MHRPGATVPPGQFLSIVVPRSARETQILGLEKKKERKGGRQWKVSDLEGFT